MFLQDRDFASGEVELDFQASGASLRPGVLFGATSPFDFLGITLEEDRLVFAEYGREERRVAATQTVSRLVADRRFRLRVQIGSSTTRAAVWAEGEARPGWQLEALHGPRRGSPGVLAVHPSDLDPVELRVSSFDVRAAAGFAGTPPACPVAITGTPVAQPDGSYSARVQAWSAWPASVVFEQAGSRAAGEWRPIAEVEADAPPFVARATIASKGRRPVYWRARLRSRTTGVETVTPVHVLRPPPGDRPLVLLAASCVQLVGPPPNQGFRRLLRAAPEPAALLVFQGDIGYANNVRNSAYAARADFFADRFQRLLARSDFAELRRETAVAFTLDDHDYGPPNGAQRNTVEPWAIELWNQVHADPSDRGYVDARFGDVHCLTLDVRRYSDGVREPDSPRKTRLGTEQYRWMERLLRESDARLFVVFCAGTFARRIFPRTQKLVDDTFVYGWPDEYRRLMTLFEEIQAGGRRVLIVSGDAHGMRVHHHPDPLLGDPASAPSVVEFICSGLRSGVWSGAPPGDATVDPDRHVLGRSGAGMVVVDPPDAKPRTITLRAVGGGDADPIDLFPPLVLPFGPARR